MKNTLFPPSSHDVQYVNTRAHASHSLHIFLDCPCVSSTSTSNGASLNVKYVGYAQGPQPEESAGRLPASRHHTPSHCSVPIPFSRSLQPPFPSKLHISTPDCRSAHLENQQRARGKKEKPPKLQ